MTSTPKSGLKSAVISTKPNYTVSQAIWDGLISFLFFVGLTMTAVTAIHLECALWLLLFSSAVVPVLMLLLFEKPVHGVFFWLLPVIGVVVCILISPTGIANGFISVCNEIFDSIGSSTGRIMTRFALLKTSSNFDNTLFLIASILLLSYPITLSVKNNHICLPSALSIAVLLFSFFVNNLSEIGFVFLIYASVGLVLKKLSGEFSASVKKIFIVRLLSLIFCMAVIMPVFISETSEQTVNFLSSTRKNAEKSIDNIRYGSGYVLPQGDFTSLGDFTPSDTPQLEIVMSKPDSYYLRGYVGEIYTENGWKQIENKNLYENADLFYWLHQENFYGQTQLGDIAKLTQSNLEQNQVIVKNIGASSKYIYLPYEVISAEDNIISFNSIRDSSFINNGFFGTKSYSFTAVNNQVKSYTTIASKIYEAEKIGINDYADYLNNESHYNEYVYENYCEVPENAEHIIETLIGTYQTDEAHLDYSKAKQKILAFLSSNIIYSEEVQAYERDFVSSFLQETKSGYSVHFATAATLMFRYYGIPARYVEGYLITPEDVKDVSSNSAITIDETHSHAWTEFYQDGVGWIPFETTTPYLDVMEKADDLARIDTQNDINNVDDDTDNESQEDTSAQQGAEEMTQQQVREILSIIITIIPILIVAVVLILLLKRIRQKKFLKKSFESEDISFSVISMFSYSIQLLCRMNVFKNSNEIYDGQKKLKNLFGEEYENKFIKAFSIYKEAEFSNHSLSENDRTYLKEFKQQTEEYFKSRRKFNLPINRKR